MRTVEPWPCARWGVCWLREEGWQLQRRIALRDAALVSWLAGQAEEGPRLLAAWEGWFGVEYVRPLRDAVRAEFVRRRRGFVRQDSVFDFA